jgi:uncharacterized protein
MEPALATLGLGLILGYLAQRSRFCLIGGLRDFVLVRDTELLKGAIAFFVTAWFAFSIAGFFGLVDLPSAPVPASPLAVAAGSSSTPASSGSILAGLPVDLTGVNWSVVALTLIAGVALGLFSTLANGCPTRQHVLAAQGMQDSAFYLAGFYGGIVVFYLLTKPLIALFM